MKKMTGKRKEPFSTHNFFKELFEDIDKFPFFAEKIPFGSDFRLVPKKQVKDLSKLRDLACSETDEFYAILNEMADTHAKKNHDYGNSFAELFDECGMTYAYAHMKEKLARVKSLMKSRQKVKEESMEDSLADLANYAVMTLVELRKKNVISMTRIEKIDDIEQLYKQFTDENKSDYGKLLYAFTKYDGEEQEYVLLICEKDIAILYPSKV